MLNAGIGLTGVALGLGGSLAGAVNAAVGARSGRFRQLRWAAGYAIMVGVGAIMAVVARRMALGETDDQIRQDMATRFGPDILLSPSHDGIVGLVWVLPLLLLGGAGVGVVLAFRRWHMTEPGAPTLEDRRRVADA